GAYCGIGSEERGQGQAIAENLMEMSALAVPIVSVIIGEGGSGGALALGVADRVLMLKHAVYSVISPEGFASILWKDASRAAEAAGVMKLTAQDLKELKVIDRIVEEREGAHLRKKEVAMRLKRIFASYLNELCAKDPQDLLAERYVKYRGMGLGRIAAADCAPINAAMNAQEAAPDCAVKLV
ncbi:MAG TPA: acetyl-CoA carboxylase carboxyl transferase subunit alpha, partial [Firmicutes bacterium]|nr:acetyl-CoA carboxylase carboxyl transferase subunit alpha [Bacillota bacterium]